jgi:pullulanase
MTSSERTFLAYLDEMHMITILLPLSYHNGISSTFSILDEKTDPVPLAIIRQTELEFDIKYICCLNAPISFGKPYWIIDEYGGKTDLQIGAVIRTKDFDEKFFYEGNDLGVTCSQNQTFFKVWAPTAIKVKVKLRNPDSSFAEIIKMKREETGTWSAVVNKDLENCLYSFLVLINQEWREAVDPYVKAVTANGELGVIVKLNKTKKNKLPLPLFQNPVDAVVYETHIRDFTIDPESGVKNKGLYLGAGELGTKSHNGDLTGLSYLKDIGITHIEVLPIHDFAGVDELDRNNSYNWGYNPVHFNVPEGSYSTDPSNPYTRIIELKQMIDSIHRTGLRVILDVVYNHVYVRENSSFEKIVPGYYFRHNEFGLPSNGTGVGNDIASERNMVRKYILDSVRFWLEEYNVDGFRVDLMGILDIETMNQVRAVCNSFSKEILLIGEGWNLNTPLSSDKKAIIRNQAKMPEIGQFNDWFRDTIKGSTFNLFDKGFALGNHYYYKAAIEVLLGSIGFKNRDSALFNEPFQSVNYVECHDNHTLWDKLVSCFPDVDDELRLRYHRLATGLVILAQGIPFLHSGQEFLRTKYGEGNSFRSPDRINKLDWNRKTHNLKNVNYIKGLIKIRKTFSCFRLRTADEIRVKICPMDLPSPLIGFIYQNNGEFQEVILYVNPTNAVKKVLVPAGTWYRIADEEDVEVSTKSPIVTGELPINPISLYILAKK